MLISLIIMHRAIKQVIVLIENQIYASNALIMVFN